MADAPGSDGMSWLQPPPGVVDVPAPTDSAARRPAGARSRAEVFAEKSDRARAVAEERVKPGACPKCAAPVMYSREVGLLTVVDVTPVYPADEVDLEGSYIVAGTKLKRATFEVRQYYGPRFVYTEHTSCGRIVPTPVKVEKKSKGDDPWADAPPFDDGSKLKTWRCWNCDEVIPPERQGVVIQYDGPNYSYYHCHCDTDCVTRERNPVKVGERKKVYPKIDKFGHYAEVKKGESMPEDGGAK